MRKILVAILLVTYVGQAFAQTTLAETMKLASLCRVWGLLKYHHPSVTGGKYDWDKELVIKLQELPAIKNKGELNALYLQWVASLGRTKKHHNDPVSIPDAQKINLNAGWLSDNSIFTDSLKEQLGGILAGKHGRRDHYARVNLDRKYIFTHEKEYEDTVYPSRELRLLCLFRYWNAINYFYPCKFANEEDWNRTLERLIPLFLDATNETQYCMAMAEMIASINDSHAVLTTPAIFKKIGKEKATAIRYSVIDGKVIVTGTTNDILAQRDDIVYGDVILSVDGVDIKGKIEYAARYTSASTVKAKMARIQVLADSLDSSVVVLDRAGKRYTRVMHRCRYEDLDRSKRRAVPDLGTNKALYIDLSAFTPGQIRHLRNDAKGKAAVIIDARYGGNNGSRKMARKLLNKRQEYVRFSTIVPGRPGMTRFDETHIVGRKNNRYYKGQVILLHNGRTQSSAEYACMMFKKAPKVICIGENTAAADGPVSYLWLPGGYRTGFSAKGVYEPNGTSLVRIGLTPDIEVSRTIEGVRAHKDEVLERALEIVRGL